MRDGILPAAGHFSNLLEDQTVEIFGERERYSNARAEDHKKLTHGRELNGKSQDAQGAAIFRSPFISIGGLEAAVPCVRSTVCCVSPR